MGFRLTRPTFYRRIGATSLHTPVVRRFALLERIARGEPLADVLREVVDLIEAPSPELIGSVMLFDEGRVTAVYGDRLPESYRTALLGLRMGPRVGSCGAAAYLNRRVIVADVETHENWVDYRELVRPHGLRACWSSPIQLADVGVVATFAMYYREPRTPTDEEFQWIDEATCLTAVALQRDRADRAVRASDARSRQLSRLYAVSSAVNAAIVRLHDPQALYELACDLVVDEGFARIAWVGLRDGRGLLRPVARAGDDDGYIDRIVLDLNDDRMNRGPVGQAFASGGPAVSNDIANDPTFFWKEEALSRGVRACATFPIAPGGRVTGVFALYTSEPGSFDQEAVGVLSSLAEQISYGIEHQRLEETARAEQTRQSIVYSMVADTIVYLSVEEGPRYRFLSVNGAFVRTTGLPEAEVVGRYLDDIIAEPALSLMLARYEEAVRTGVPVTWEEESRYPGGLRRGEVMVAPVLDAEGRCTHLIGTVHDVTGRAAAEAERRQLERQLHQAQRLQSLGTLAGGIAHDFNNLLSAIRGYTELALADIENPAAATLNLEEVTQASRRAAALIKRILLFSRGEEPSLRSVSVAPLVDEVVHLLRGAIKGPLIETETAANLLPVTGDATQMHQVLMNLVTNAAQAIGAEPGTIRIVCENVDIGDEVPVGADLTPGRYVRITVADSGCGIDAATLERVFEPFFTTKDPSHGTGLGLSVVHGIMQSHHGAVTVTSQPGEGTTFRLFFPASDPAVPAGSSLEASTGARVLYVDDDEALVHLAERALSRLGYVVTGFADSTQALAVLRAVPDEFDAVVADAVMPGLSGLDFIRQARAIRPGLAAVLVSGYVRAEDAEAARALGLPDLVMKPQTAQEFAAILDAHLRPRG